MRSIHSWSSVVHALSCSVFGVFKCQVTLVQIHTVSGKVKRMKVTDSSVSTAPINSIMRPLLVSSAAEGEHRVGRNSEPSAGRRSVVSLRLFETSNSSPRTAPTLFSPGMAALFARCGCVLACVVSKLVSHDGDLCCSSRPVTPRCLET